jgi:crotonobetainyl-CoA:carnitine CoA-transferase CaiB-like acyl-CoA transferase
MGDLPPLLTGLRVLDLSIWRPGPYATQLLAEVGADVLKVEPPGGDPMRSYPELFAVLNAGKRGVVLDLKAAAGRAEALALAADADVVVEGFRPGVVDRLGVGYDAVRSVNASVVYCSVSGLGQDGPLASASGHDLNYQAWAGTLAPEGREPVVPAIPVADLAGGMAAAFAITAAAFRRSFTGEGEHVDVAMADVLASWTGAARPRATGVDASARNVPGYGVFATADGGFVTLGIVTEDHFWSSLCDALGLGDAARLPFLERMTRIDELQASIASAIAKKPRDDLVATLLAANVPAAPVLSRDEMLDLDHFRARGLVQPRPSLGHPVRFSAHKSRPLAAAPGLDEHRSARFRPRD